MKLLKFANKPFKPLIHIGLGFLLLLIFSSCGSRHNRVDGYVEGEFVYVASPFAGALKKLRVDRGSQVKANDLLFSLDDTQERAERDQTQAALTLSEAEFARQDKLSKVLGANSKKDLERALSIRDQDKERLTAADWKLSQKSQSSLEEALVFDTLYREGEFVPAGRPVVVLLPPKNVKVRVFIPEPQLGGIKIGVPVTVSVDGMEEKIEGKVSFISPRSEFTPPVIYSKDSRAKLVNMIEISFAPEIAVKLHPGQPVTVQIGN